EGYDVKGDEWSKRQLLFSVIETLQKQLNGSQLLSEYGHFSKEQIRKMNRVVSGCEQELKISFTDNRHRALPYMFACILRRIELGFTIIGKEVDLSSEKAYRIVSNLLDPKDTLPSEEISYIALQILTANLSHSFDLKLKVEPVMVRGLRIMLENFEKISCTVLH
ncbi:PRD domain-containing protein, partial [Micrococcus sp. SIMBA_144]